MDMQRIDVTEALEPLIEALTRDGAAMLVRAGEPAMEVRATVGFSPQSSAAPDLLSEESVSAAAAWRVAHGLGDIDAAALVRAMRDEDD